MIKCEMTVDNERKGVNVSANIDGDVDKIIYELAMIIRQIKDSAKNAGHQEDVEGVINKAVELSNLTDSEISVLFFVNELNEKEFLEFIKGVKK